MRTFRNRSTVLAATTTAVLALTLTACGDNDTGTKSAGPAVSAGATVAAQPGSEKATDDAQETGTTGSGGTEQAVGTAKGSGTTGSASSSGGTSGASAPSAPRRASRSPPSARTARPTPTSR